MQAHHSASQHLVLEPKIGGGQHNCSKDGACRQLQALLDRDSKSASMTPITQEPVFNSTAAALGLLELKREVGTACFASDRLCALCCAASHSVSHLLWQHASYSPLAGMSHSSYRILCMVSARTVVYATTYNVAAWRHMVCILDIVRTQ